MLRSTLLLPGMLIAALALTMLGCGPKYPETVPVSGTVTLDKKPVAGAAVVFTPTEGDRATGTTDPSGKFELSTYRLGDGAVPGKHRVTVTKTTVEPGTEEKIVFVIPLDYGKPDTSNLTCDVQKEMDPVQLNLEPTGPTKSQPSDDNSTDDEPSP